ncbi:MAG TPA: hypothetical protein PLW35_03870, partial [Verrucomicrobiota bacterium]|nr:hypothetical protein [Verrucomicrobiota bacterium]
RRAAENAPNPAERLVRSPAKLRCITMAVGTDSEWRGAEVKHVGTHLDLPIRGVRQMVRPNPLLWRGNREQ